MVYVLSTGMEHLLDHFAHSVIKQCHFHRLGNNYEEAKANSFPTVQKKMWFMGGPEVDKVSQKVDTLCISDCEY